MTLEPDVQRLAAAIRDLEAYLHKRQIPQWAEAMGRAAALVEMGEAQGLYEFQRMYGGMGSFNDLVLTDGNEELERLRVRAFDLAQQVKRSHLRI